MTSECVVLNAFDFRIIGDMKELIKEIIVSATSFEHYQNMLAICNHLPNVVPDHDHQKTD